MEGQAANTQGAQASTTQTQAQNAEGGGTQTSQAAAAQGTDTGTGLDFIPEKYRTESWASKYDTADKFFDGISNLNKMAGQKEVVQGLQAPGENATQEDWNKFYSDLGRPETSEKYTLPEDVKAFEGFDLATEKKTFSDLAHKNGLTQKQAEGLFKDYMANVNESHEKNSQAQQLGMDEAVKAAFGDKSEEGFALAKKGAKALGIGVKLDSEGLSANPLVLQLCAKLGELAGEDTFVPSNDQGTGESLLEEAMKLQKSAEYRSGDKATHAKVEAIYKKVYPN